MIMLSTKNIDFKIQMTILRKHEITEGPLFCAMSRCHFLKTIAKEEVTMPLPEVSLILLTLSNIQQSCKTDKL